jgi:hypothetical protein
LREDILLEKLMGRRTCVNCGTGFNVCNIQRYIIADNLEMDIQWIHFYQRNKAFVITADTSLLSEKMILRKSFQQE